MNKSVPTTSYGYFSINESVPTTTTN
jgi:hypothetical protein